MAASDVAVVHGGGGDDEDGAVFDQTPVKVCCPRCGKNVITFTQHEASWVTYAVSMGLLWILNWAALFIVPVIFPLFKDVVHHCPRCLSRLATRPRVVWPSLRQEVLSFRFGSCVVVLARRYALLLGGLISLIMTAHFLRSGGAGSAQGVEDWQRGSSINATWDDFLKECGVTTYLGNPIHVGVAFEEKFQNRTVSWEGTVDRSEGSMRIPIVGIGKPGAVLVRMAPQQVPNRDVPDLVLLYAAGAAVEGQAARLARGQRVSFNGTMMQVGKRGAPHVLALWDVKGAAAAAPAVRPRAEPAAGGV